MINRPQSNIPLLFSNSADAEAYYNQLGTSIKEFKIKQLFYRIISRIYLIFLILFSITIIYLLGSRDNGCDNYIPYLLIFLFGCISYIILLGLNNITSQFNKFYFMFGKFPFLFLIIGVAFKLAFIIYSFIIYYRAYGDCYLPYKTQLIFMIGSFIEAIILILFEISWRNTEKIIKSV